MSGERATALERTFRALGDATRLAVVGLLGEQPRRASDIAAALDLTRPAASRHLRILRQAGVVEESSPEHDARERIYRLRTAKLRELRTWLDEIEGFWGEQLSSFKAHVEASTRRGRRRR